MADFKPQNKNEAISFIQLQLWDMIHNNTISVIEGKAIIVMLEALKDLR